MQATNDQTKTTNNEKQLEELKRAVIDGMVKILTSSEGIKVVQDLSSRSN